MRIALALAVLVAGCGKRTEDPAPQPQRASPKLRPLVRHAGATLVASGRSVAVVTGDGWLESAPGAFVARSEIGAQIAKLRGELAGDFQIFLGREPIVVGGEEHHERHVRIAVSQIDVALEGHLVRVAASPARELWQIEERLRAQLVVVAGAQVTALPAFELLAPPERGLSPVGEKKCATPQIADLTATRDAVAALIVECNAEAPVRIASYRDALAVVQLPSRRELGFTPSHLAGERAVVGIDDRGRLVMARVGGAAPTRALDDVTVVIAAALADDGAIWTLSITRHGARGTDLWQVARDGVLVTLADPANRALKPARLAADEHHGIVVLAEDWLLVER